MSSLWIVTNLGCMPYAKSLRRPHAVSGPEQGARTAPMAFSALKKGLALSPNLCGPSGWLLAAWLRASSMSWTIHTYAMDMRAAYSRLPVHAHSNVHALQ